MCELATQYIRLFKRQSTNDQKHRARSLGFAFVFISVALHAQLSTIAALGSDSSPTLNGIRMIDSLRGWASSANGIWQTVNGGATWMRAPYSGVMPATAWGVTAEGGAWGLDGVPKSKSAIELTRFGADGKAERWPTPCSPDIDCYSAVAAFTSDGQNGILAGIIEGEKDHDRARGYRTVNGGRTWSELPAFPSRIYRGDLTIVVTSESQAFAVTGCDFYLTSDFGNTWIKSKNPMPSVMCSGTSNPYTIRFYGPANGWLRTDDGWILRSEDGGASWSVSSLGHQTIYFPKQYDSWVSFSGNADGLMTIQGRLFSTHDGGAQWTIVPSSGEKFASVSCAHGRCIVSSDRRIATFIFQ